jgi:hypothetical protein
MGHSFEELARGYAHFLIAEGSLPGDAVWSWWSNDGRHEIDIVGTAARRPTFIGSVKWRRELLGEAALNDIERERRRVGSAEYPATARRPRRRGT